MTMSPPTRVSYRAFRRQVKTVYARLYAEPENSRHASYRALLNPWSLIQHGARLVLRAVRVMGKCFLRCMQYMVLLLRWTERGLSNLMNPRWLYDQIYQRRQYIMPMFKHLSSALWWLQHSALSRWIVTRVASAPAERGRLVSIRVVATRRVLCAALAVHIFANERTRTYGTARVLNLLFREDILRRRPLVTYLYFKALFQLTLSARTVREIQGREVVDGAFLNYVIGMAFMREEYFADAIYYFTRSLEFCGGTDYYACRMLGRCELMLDDEPAAKAQFERSVSIAPFTVMAYQNGAARYNMSAYKPVAWELEHAGELLIYDVLNQQAEDYYLQGKMEASFATYDRMLKYQDRIAQNKELPLELRQRLNAYNERFDVTLPTRILPYEWVIQFGHIACIDSYLKHASLKGEQANFVVLAPHDKIANRSYLAEFEQVAIIVRDEALIDEIFPYQRYFGDCFMAARMQDGGSEPWMKAIARMQTEWGHKGGGSLLKFDRAAYAKEQQLLAEAGIPVGAWYVGLHVREGGFYNETQDGFNGHRNARIEEYFEAVRAITDRGGYVIRLGDSSMKPLPAMENVFDYATSRFKSERMDIYLMATSRLIIGTTSGLTTATQTFGTPTLLVNCISNDWQIWDAQADFMLKRIWSRKDRRYLSIGETYGPAFQGNLISNILLNRLGYEAHSNPAAEIRDAVVYKLDVLDGKARRMDASHHLMQRYWQEIPHAPYLFGAAVPALPYLQNEANRGALGEEIPPLKYATM